MVDEKGALRPLDLRTERATSPLGIDDPTPLLSWRLSGDGHDRRQRGYRVQVIREHDGVVAWDSGVVNSDETANVAYGGSPLDSRTRYQWRVRITDENDVDSGWSDPATWETGLGAEEWHASWITNPTELSQAYQPNLDSPRPTVQVRRIWVAGRSDRTGHAFCRTLISVTPGSRIISARLYFGGLCELEVYVNGRRVDSDADIGHLLHIGRNSVAVGGVGTTDRPGGLVGRIDIQREGAEAITSIADDQWRATDHEEPGWADPEFDDSRWPLAREMELHGHPPLGREEVTHRPSPVLRREFSLDGEITQARLYVTALGIYDFWINGKRVGTDRMNPGWTDYRTRIPYHTYDVTELLRSGVNAAGVVVADGWYSGWLSWLGQFHYGRHRAVRAELAVQLTDGRTISLPTDSSWRAGDGSVRYADLQNGEVVDARREPTGWTMPNFDPSWGQPAEEITVPVGQIESAVVEPVRAIHEFAPRSIVERRPGVWIVDFGQNMAGWVRLRARGAAGHRIMVRHAEVLDTNGDLYVEALRGARATDEFILAGHPDGEVFEPRFTFHGFRYAEVLNYPGELMSADITGLAAHADMEQIGEFSCSSEPLNKLQQNIVWGLRGNFLSVPTDCPQRDERLGWTGDAQIFAATAAYNYDVRPFFRKWLRDLRDAQRPDGAVTHVVPDILSPQETEPGVNARSAGWGDAVAIVPAAMLRAYGDKRAVEETLDAIDSWLNYLDRRGPADYGYGDWLAVTDTPKVFVSTAYFAYTARLATTLAEQVGELDYAKRWRALADRVRADFRATYVRGGGRLKYTGEISQTAYVFALYAELFDEHERPAAVERLVADIESRGHHLTTGFLGTPWLLDVLSDNGRIDVAYRLLLQDTYPSWLFPVVHGDATTMWERWDSWSESRGFADSRMTSFNHYAYGAVGDWIYRTVAGIRAAEPGYRRIVIAPRPCAGITWATGAVLTPHGEIKSSWRYDDTAFELDVVVPPNTTAEITLPVCEGAELGHIHVGSGRYHYRVPRNDFLCVSEAVETR